LVRAKTQLTDADGHSNAKTTGLYDQRNDDISVGELRELVFENLITHAFV